MFLILFISISVSNLSYSEDKKCLSVFITAREEIAKKVPSVSNSDSDKESFRNNYGGQEGYVRFVSALKGTESMDYVFQEVSMRLEKSERDQMGWQQFQGKVSEFKELSKQILNEDGSVKEEYTGKEGYARFSAKYLSGNMKKTYMNVSAVLGKSEMDQLDWQKFQGKVSEFKKLREKILNEDGSVKEEYTKMEGYARFSAKHFSGNMLKAYQNVSAVLRKSEMDKLEWQEFQGKVSEFKELREKILNEDGSVKEEYTEMKGYARFSAKHFPGNMLKAYQNVSAVLEKSEMDQLDWQGFQGKVSEFKKLRKKILNEDSSVKEEYTEMKGYARFSAKHFSGNMHKAYQNVSAVLEKSEMDQLDWQGFQGKVSEFKKLRKKILNEDSSVKEEYTEMKGYARFSAKHFSGNMHKAYQNVSAVLEKSEMDKLDWQGFKGKVSGFKKLREKILNEDGSVKKEYKGMEGYARFSAKHFSGNMHKAYQNVSAVLGGFHAIKELDLEWKVFIGTVNQFVGLKGLFNRYDLTELEGVKGQEKVAREIFNNNLTKAYDKVSVLREELLGSRKAFKKLNWRK